MTGGMDDLVRVWEYSPEGDLRLKHKLAEHSLGVVSVNLTKDAKRKFFLFLWVLLKIDPIFLL